MAKIYFSKVWDAGKWVEDNDVGYFHIVLIPKKWWSIKVWQILFDFRRNFKSGFITKDVKDGAE